MNRVFEIAECEEVRNSILLVQRYEKHENRMTGCAVELKVSDWQMNAWSGPRGLVILQKVGHAGMTDAAHPY